MYIGGALVLIAIGAILRWAVNVTTSAINVHLAGLIVFIVGIVGLLVTLAYWFSCRSGAPLAPPPSGSPDNRAGPPH
jgi:hypothetical protein